jgi:hypothetical protein
MPRRPAKKATPKRFAKERTTTRGSKKLTSEERSARMKASWRKRKAKKAREEARALVGGPTARKAQVEDDGVLHEQPAPDYWGTKKYFLAQGSTLMDFNNGPYTREEVEARLDAMFQADPQLKEIMLLEVGTITFRTTHKLELETPNGTTGRIERRVISSTNAKTPKAVTPVRAVLIDEG